MKKCFFNMITERLPAGWEIKLQPTKAASKSYMFTVKNQYHLLEFSYLIKSETLRDIRDPVAFLLGYFTQEIENAIPLIEADGLIVEQVNSFRCS